jgi:hypothetical protein
VVEAAGVVEAGALGLTGVQPFGEATGVGAIAADA